MKINFRDALLGIGAVALYLGSIQDKAWEFFTISATEKELTGIIFFIGTMLLAIFILFGVFIYLDKLNTYLVSIIIYETPKKE